MPAGSREAALGHPLFRIRNSMLARFIRTSKGRPIVRAHAGLAKSTYFVIGELRTGYRLSCPLRVRMGPSQSWGSGGHRHWRVWAVGRQEFLPEAGAERAVVESAADLEQQIGPRRVQRICCALTMRRFTRKLAVPSVSAVLTRCPARCRSA